MKKLLKKQIVNILSGKVRKLYKRHTFTTIVIAGSVGKTSTKFAIASMLKQKYRVRFQEGNYNDIVSVPLVFFGLEIPSLFNPVAWFKTFRQIDKIIIEDYPYDFVILELGTDGPGQINQFKNFIHADIGVLTAIAPEHMEYFEDLDAVAKEELAIAEMCDHLIVNQDLCDQKYLDQLTKPILKYSIRDKADYQLTDLVYHDEGYEFSIQKKGQNFVHATHESIAESQLYSLCAAVAVGDVQLMNAIDITQGLQKIISVNGRMNKLRGIKNSTILDDTYNASPEATKGALDTLYKINSPQKIAILGNMNELGKYSQAAHTEIGEYCDSKNLDMVITIGPDANKYLAPAAEKKGCIVKTFTNPHLAGQHLLPLIQEKAVILAKGSQNGVFAEEAIKPLLNDPNDISKLVRQSDHWQKIKQKQFGKTQ